MGKCDCADLVPTWHRTDDPDNPPPMDGTPVDIWVPDETYETGGQRFPDMIYRPGDIEQANDWDCLDEMLSLSDMGYGVGDVSHWMPQPPPPDST